MGVKQLSRVDPRIYSVEAVNQLVLKGIPFREAYQKIADEIDKGTFEPPSDVRYSHEGSIGNLKNDKILEALEKTAKSFDFQKVDQALKSLLNNKNTNNK
jgi:argininosuccinate lyase